jgi:predicted MFS family arabinose efflux permease
MKSLTAICSTTFLLSMVNESFRPANATAIAHYSKESTRIRSYGLNRLAINLGWACGTALGGFIASYDYKWLFWLDGISNMLAAFMLWNLLRHTRVTFQKKSKLESIKARSTSGYRDFKYLFFCLLVTLFATCFFQLFTNLPAFYRNELKYNEKLIGFLGAVNGLTITFFEMVIIFRLEGRRAPFYYIVRGVLLCAFAYTTLLFLPEIYPSALLMMLIMTLGEIMSIPFMNAWWMGRSSADNRGSYAALYNMSWSVAQSIGPMTGAFIAAHFGFKGLWTGAAIAMALTAMGFYLLSKNNHPLLRSTT